MKSEVRKEMINLIKNYRDDIDLQGLIDWVQADWVSIMSNRYEYHYYYY